MVAQAFGTPLGAAKCMFNALQHMTFHMRTAHGDSDLTFGGLHSIFQGLAQGNGAAPACWLAISIILILLQKRQGHGMEITSALTADRKSTRLNSSHH